jgi:hypothetical protein
MPKLKLNPAAAQAVLAAEVHLNEALANAKRVLEPTRPGNGLAYRKGN